METSTKDLQKYIKRSRKREELLHQEIKRVEKTNKDLITADVQGIYVATLEVLTLVFWSDISLSAVGLPYCFSTTTTSSGGLQEGEIVGTLFLYVSPDQLGTCNYYLTSGGFEGGGAGMNFWNTSSGQLVATFVGVGEIDGGGIVQGTDTWTPC